MYKYKQKRTSTHWLTFKNNNRSRKNSAWRKKEFWLNKRKRKTSWTEWSKKDQGRSGSKKKIVSCFSPLLLLCLSPEAKTVVLLFSSQGMSRKKTSIWKVSAKTVALRSCNFDLKHCSWCQFVTVVKLWGTQQLPTEGRGLADKATLCLENAWVVRW